jgi:putative PIN family toxin of toxin-antitoxin system
MRVVADTNTLVSGFLWDGLPARLLDAGLTGRFGLYSSTELLSELDETLRAPKFAERLTIRGHNAESLVRAFRFSCHEVVSPPRVAAPELRDSDDLHVLSCAAAVPVDLIVSGDKDLLVLKSFRGIPIVTARRALEILGLFVP